MSLDSCDQKLFCNTLVFFEDSFLFKDRLGDQVRVGRHLQLEFLVGPNTASTLAKRQRRAAVAHPNDARVGPQKAKRSLTPQPASAAVDYASTRLQAGVSRVTARTKAGTKSRPISRARFGATRELTFGKGLTVRLGQIAPAFWAKIWSCFWHPAFAPILNTDALA